MTDTPKQWRMVPVEPDEAMTLAGRNAAQSANAHSVGWSDEAKAVWSAMCAASPAPDLEGLRERVARVIDPRSFEDLAYATERLPAEPRSKYFTDLARLSRDGVDAALAKADAVLALIFTPEGEGRE